MTRLPSEYGIAPWQPEIVLPSFALSDIRFSRGFLTADYLRLCRKISTLWVPVLSAAEVELTDIRVVADFNLPNELDRTFLFRVDGELSVIGVSSRTEDILARLFLETGELKASKLLCDYLSRRLVSSLARFCSDDAAVAAPMSFGYQGEAELRDVEIEGHLSLSLSTRLGEIGIHLGFGPEFLQRLDRTLRTRTLAEWGLKPEARKQQFAVDLGSFPDLPEELEPGAWFDTEIDVLSPVRLLSPTGEIFFGRLGQFNGRFSVRALKGAPQKLDRNGVRLELARGELAEEELIFMRKDGAIFPTRNVVSSAALLVRGDELLANVTLAELEGRFVIRIDEVPL